MEKFRGRLQPHEDGNDDYVNVGIDDHWVRIWGDHKRYGSWGVGDIPCERITVFRFELELDETRYTFYPDDPGGFAEAMHTVVDLRPTSRFGLGERVKAARAELKAAGAGEESAPTSG